MACGLSFRKSVQLKSDHRDRCKPGKGRKSLLGPDHCDKALARRPASPTVFTATELRFLCARDMTDTAPPRVLGDVMHLFPSPAPRLHTNKESQCPHE